MAENTKKQKENFSIKDVGFFRILIGAIKVRIFGSTDPIYERIVLLKKVKKDLKKINIKAINFSKDRIDPAFGLMLFEIYRYFYPLKKIIDFSKPSKIKDFLDFVITSYANEKQKEILGQLRSEKFILETIGTQGSKKASEVLKNLYKELNSSFNKEQIKKINQIFSLGESLYHFLRYDFYMFLRKMAGDFKEDNITVPPNFREVDIKIIETDIKDFTDHVYALNIDANYFEFIQMYSQFIQKDIIPQEDFQKMMQSIARLVKTNFLMLLVQYISQDAFFRPYYSYNEKNVFSDFMKELVVEINQAQNKAAESIKNQTLEKIKMELFGEKDFMELSSYTLEQSEILIKNNIGAFAYVEALNVTKKFLMERYNRYIRSNLNTLIVKATFSENNFRERLNTIYYAINGVMDKILEFENKMKGKDGWERIHNLVRGKSKDSGLAYLAKKYVGEANDQAKEIVELFIELIEECKEKLRTIVEAYNKGLNEPVSNIKNFAGATTNEVIKNIASGFNDMSKLLVYFKMTFNPK